MPLAKISDLNGPPNEVGACISVARTLSTMYEDFLRSFPGDSHERAPGIHASELNKCLRQTAYSLRAVQKKEDIAPSWRKRFEIGHAVHNMVQAHFKRMCVQKSKEVAADLASRYGWYVSFESEVKCSPEHQELARHYKIYSSCDGVFTFTDPETGTVMLRVGLEIKSEAPDSFEKLKEPKPDHVQQTHVYMACLDLPLMWFFYFNKGNQNSTESGAPWLVVWNPDIWQRLAKRAEEVLSHDAAGTEPDREEGTHCEFCPYSWKCEPSKLAYKNRKFISVRRPGGP